MLTNGNLHFNHRNDVKNSYSKSSDNILPNSGDKFFGVYFQKLNNNICNVDHSLLIDAAQLILETKNKSKKVMIFGNGGSAAIASHIAVDFTKAANIRSTNYNEADLITCLSNDFGYENWVSKAIEFYSDKGDVVILISSSGKSPNIINGAKMAKKLSLPLISFTGFSHDNEITKNSILSFWVDSKEYNIVEMSHHIWLVAIVDYICNLNIG